MQPEGLQLQLRGPATLKVGEEAQVQLVAVANGDPLSFAGIDVSAVVGASERLTGLRGNTARMQWVAEGVAEFVAAEAASPVSDSSDEVPAGE